MFRRHLSKTLLLLASIAPLAHAAEPLQVFVGVLPQQTFVERIGGEHVVVESLVKSGQSPHTYDPTPSQIARLAEADLYVGIGLPFESAWSARIRSVNPDMPILDLSKGVGQRAMEAHDHAEEDAGHAHAAHEHETDAHDHQELDPHIWTSPMLVKQMGGEIARTLTDLDPDHAADYAANLAVFETDLDTLDADIRATLAGVQQRRFMVFHPAWDYFADAYQLTQIPIERDGKEPGPRSLTVLIDQARRENVKVIFVQPQFSRKSAEQVARAIGGRVEVIDNLAPDYFANLRRVAEAIAASERDASSR